METLRPCTFEIAASELPESFAARLPERPAVGARLFVTVEPAASDEEKFWALKAAINEGLADLDAGRSSDGEDVLARLEKRFPPP